VWTGHREPWGIEHASVLPLFTPELIQMMRELIPADRHASVAVSVIIKARKPA
jgi:arsenite methyltransferase